MSGDLKDIANKDGTSSKTPLEDLQESIKGSSTSGSSFGFESSTIFGSGSSITPGSTRIGGSESISSFATDLL